MRMDLPGLFEPLGGAGLGQLQLLARFLQPLGDRAGLVPRRGPRGLQLLHRWRKKLYAGLTLSHQSGAVTLSCAMVRVCVASRYFE